MYRRPASLLPVIEYGVQVYNGLALMMLSLHPRFSVHRFAGPAIVGGGLVFSGSIWCLVAARERYVAYSGHNYGTSHWRHPD